MGRQKKINSQKLGVKVIGRCIRDRVSEGSEYWGAKCQLKGPIPRGDEIRLFPKDCHGAYNLGSLWK